MFRRPRFQPHLGVEVVPGEGVFLLSELHQVVLQGRLYELIAPCLDGSTIEEMCERLRGQATTAQVCYTLTQLEKRGYLSEADDARPAAEAALWAEQQIDPAGAGRRLAETSIAVHAIGSVDIEPLCELLRTLGVRIGGTPALTVVATDSYLRGDLRKDNEAALRDGRPWLLVKPIGRWIWFGPLFVPGKTGCWHCLTERIQANAPVLAYLESKRGQTGEAAAHRAGTAATRQIAWGLAATAVASWIGRGDLPHLDGKIRTLDVLTGEAQTHTLVRRPTCPTCGEAMTIDRPVSPVVIGSSKKTFTEDGGHRVCSPQQTLERYGHHVSAITGAVSMLERDTSGDGVLHVYLSGPNSARRARSLRGLRSDLRSSNCGKGTSDAETRASALCEGLERYSGTFRGDEPRRRARWHDLGDAAIAPNVCLRFSDKQYRERDVWNAAGHRFDQIPLPFEPSAEIEWTPVWSLSRQTVRYLPAAYCWFNYPQPAERTFCYACSNGNAAGNTIEEAIVQGFLELVERDSVALWWYNRVRRPAVDLDSFAEPYLDRLREFLHRHHRELWALDVTSDLGVPAIAAVSRRTDGGAEQILFGLGAHLDARVALLRAVTELNQMLGPLLNVPADDPAASHLTDRATLQWLRTATLDNQPYLKPLDGSPRRAADFPACRSDDLKDDVLFCQQLAERQGSELLVLDQTRREIGLPVVKVIVPGLRHFWARFAPGRLYDVPVRLGWLSRPRTEEELNPIPMFLQRPEYFVDPAWILSLPQDVTVSASADGELTLIGPQSRIALRRLSPGLRDALLRLATPGESAGRLAEQLRAVEGPDVLARWFYHLQRLAGQRWLRLSAYADNDCLATLEPITPAFVLPPTGTGAQGSFVLSRFAWTYRRGDVLALESPLSNARIILHDARAAAFVQVLSQPATAADLRGRVAGLPAEAVAPLLGLLLHAGMVCAVGEDGTTAEEADPALRFWEFHDLLFHSRSREGRHDAPIGALYPWAGRVEPPPALPPSADAEMIDLYRPDLEQLQRRDPPLAHVQEKRRSIRQYAAEPIGARQLGEFLYRVARVRQQQVAEVETPAGPVRMDFASRPYPAGGGLYELEVYAVVNACRNLDSGLYHYDPLGHRLGRRAGRTAAVERLLSVAAQAAGMTPQGLQVVLVLAARLPRIAWKYSGLAYALILKDVGVVFQTMYLAATAMGLAPCALGSGDGELFAQAAGVSGYAEPAVGEFLLGSAPRHAEYSESISA